MPGEQEIMGRRQQKEKLDKGKQYQGSMNRSDATGTLELSNHWLATMLPTHNF